MDKDFYIMFLTIYSITITIQLFIKIGEKIKLKEKNDLLKDNIKIIKKSKTFYLEVNPDYGIEDIAKEIQDAMSDDTI